MATLGPEGTSSEAAAEFLGGLCAGVLGGVQLHDTYERAWQAVVSGAASYLLVANAYSGVNRFYMDLRLRLRAAFVMDTPPYGLAVRDDRPVPAFCRAVSHPAPTDLVTQLLPPGYLLADLGLAASTSTAAIRTAEGDYDMALTTAPAAHRAGLVFISPVRTIEMLWSVFARNHVRDVA